MKKIDYKIEAYRIKVGKLASDKSFGNNGAFQIPYKNIFLTVIISDGNNWEHVSVRLSGFKRLPDWDEMNYIKNLFWNKNETVIQFHPAHSEYISNYEVLHLWKKIGRDYELPPGILIGIK